MDLSALAPEPSLVLAEGSAPDTLGLEGECPDQTRQAIQLTWERGVIGPQGANLADAQRSAISVLLEIGDSVHPLSPGDDDPDNHVIACLAEISLAIEITSMIPVMMPILRQAPR